LRMDEISSLTWGRASHRLERWTPPSYDTHLPHGITTDLLRAGPTTPRFWFHFCVR
jgi:hypothetical protein